ncbi:hypothetical protein QM467_00670 [Rhodoblastus sp. 17X3]|uniref:hypothetical protein n=1 Tax=Rhodoblastus sp. 17X3 TaxID=3047026 RepID=UPI0024B745B4|nr:hypothetical protein [Rhodoblastus sp. 17X3]MDI9846564.1 hypothetical protein [Rhodoblastus sp. 17X3]
MTNEPEFPLPIRMRGRLFWRRSELELYKRRLMAAALGGTVPEIVPDQIETFVPAEQVAREFGFGRRTLGRRIAGRNSMVAAAE